MIKGNFKMKKLCSKTFKTLTGLNRPVAAQYMSQQNSQKKAICINSILVYSVS